jgi:hypothetical protein
MLTAIYHMLHNGTFYQGRGAKHFHGASPADPAKRLVRQIAKLGVTCLLTPAAAKQASV